MKKCFKKKLGSENEIRLIDTETGEFTRYMQDKCLGFTFSNYHTTVYEMGYKSVSECLKELKKRNLLGCEVDLKEQKQSEKLGLLNLGAERIKRVGRINTLDFEDVIKKLSGYGLNYVDAQNQIIGNYLYLEGEK